MPTAIQKVERAGTEFKLIWYRGSYSVQFYDNYKRKRVALGTKSEAEARARFLDFLDDFSNHSASITSKSFADATVETLWLVYQKQQAGKAFAKQLPFSWKALSPSIGGLRARSLTTEDCQKHIAKRRQAKIKDGTLHTELGHLQSMLNFAAKQGWISAAPYIERPKKPKSKTPHLSEEEAQRFMAEIKSPHIKLFCELALMTAGRKTAILELTWDRVDFENNTIQLENPDDPMRRKKRAQVPMGQKLRQLLLTARQASLTDHVIEYCGAPVKDVKKALQRAAERADLDWVTAHVMRHTAAVWMAKSGIGMIIVSQYLGHSNSRITEEIYARFRPDYMKDANAALEDAFLN